MKEVVIPDGNETVISQEAFYSCDNLKSVVLGNGVKRVDSRAFYDCVALNYLVLGTNLEYIGKAAFSLCDEITNLSIPGSVKTIDANAFANSSIENIVINEGVETIGDGAFNWNQTIYSLVLPKSVNSIGKDAFSGCTMADLVVKNPDCQFAEDIGYCSSNIYGYEGSTAQEYAIAKGKTFHDLDKDVYIATMLGRTRIETALAISLNGWGSDSENVILVNGFSFADALAGVPLAKALDAPILLTQNSAAGLEESVYYGIATLHAKNIYILGGAGVVSQTIEDKLTADGYNVTRIGGMSRFSTAVKIAERLENIQGKADGIFAVTAYDYPDALSASSVAAILGDPILYVNPDGTIESETQKYLLDSSITQAHVVGGAGVIGEDIDESLADCGLTSIERVYGKDRFTTCIAVNTKFANLFDNSAVSIATGYAYPDALSGGALSARLKIPVILVDKYERIPEGTEEFMQKFDLRNLYAYGGIVSDVMARVYSKL